jgi:hypothetical protein
MAANTSINAICDSDISGFHSLTFSLAVKMPNGGRFSISRGYIQVWGSKMLESGLEKRLANLVPMKPGENRHTRKAARVAVKLEELRREFFPTGGEGAVDAGRLRLAAQHYFTAETCRDPVVAQRATRCAEYLLSKLKPPAAPRSPAADQAALALELLLNKPPDDV